MDQAYGKTISIDAVPEKIDVHEKYNYEILVSGSVDTKIQSSSGEVRVEVPYDGYKHFSRESAQRVAKWIGKGPSIQGHIGWMAVSKALDWENDWRRQPGIMKIPLLVPLSSDSLQGEELWTSDKFRAIIQQGYDPQGLNYWPVNIQLEIYDDRVSMSDSLEDYLTSLQQTDLLEGGLLFNLIITVEIPQVLVHQDVRVVLDQITIDWPTIVSSEQLAISGIQLTKDKGTELFFPAWRYDPDAGSVELRNIQFLPGKPKPGSPLAPYECNLSLWSGFPGDIIRSGIMQGKLDIHIDQLLMSGRELALFNSAGKLVECKAGVTAVKQWSEVAARFEVILADQFARKNTTGYRRWTFPGVDLTRERIWDISEALRDLGYQLDGEAEKEEETIISRTIRARRAGTLDNGDPIFIRQDVRMTRVKGAETRTEREIPSGLLVSTELKTSDLIVEIFGRMNCPGSLLDTDLENLMVILQQRLSAVADLR